MLQGDDLLAITKPGGGGERGATTACIVLNK